MTQQFDVLAIGNAIVDIVVQVDEAFLEKHALHKGAMTLIDQDKALELYQDMPKGTQVSGGSAANTIAGVANFGGKGAYVGKVHQDELGDFFANDLRNSGVDYATVPTIEGDKTAFSLIFVTPDAARTMATFLGATRRMTKDDIDEALIAGSQYVYLEGYLWDEDNAIEAMIKAIHVAHHNNKKVAFTLSDPFCVDRHRDAFQELVEHSVDILFANEDEIVSLYQSTGFEGALDKVQGLCDIIAVTRSEKGSIIVTKDARITIEAEPIGELVDTTGAGDMYAAGFLYALSQGKSLTECGRLGSVAAGQIIQHYGARPLERFAA